MPRQLSQSLILRWIRKILNSGLAPAAQAIAACGSGYMKPAALL
jgi:hypothetical protein